MKSTSYCIFRVLSLGAGFLALVFAAVLLEVSRPESASAQYGSDSSDTFHDWFYGSSSSSGWGDFFPDYDDPIGGDGDSDDSWDYDYDFDDWYYGSASSYPGWDYYFGSSSSSCSASCNDICGKWSPYEASVGSESEGYNLIDELNSEHADECPNFSLEVEVNSKNGEIINYYRVVGGYVIARW